MKMLIFPLLTALLTFLGAGFSELAFAASPTPCYEKVRELVSHRDFTRTYGFNETLVRLPMEAPSKEWQEVGVQLLMPTANNPDYRVTVFKPGSKEKIGNVITFKVLEDDKNCSLKSAEYSSLPANSSNDHTIYSAAFCAKLNDGPRGPQNVESLKESWAEDLGVKVKVDPKPGVKMRLHSYCSVKSTNLAAFKKERAARSFTPGSNPESKPK